MTGRELPPQQMGRWPGGANNVLPAQDLQKQRAPAVRGAVNVDFSDTGKPKRRRGFAQKIAGIAHSLWGHESLTYALLVLDSQLKRMKFVDGAEEFTDLTPAHPTRRWSFCAMNGEALGSNGLATARVDSAGALQPWGVEAPGGQPSLGTLAAGGLTAGRYQVAITYVNGAGEESGSEQAAVIDVPEGGGLLLSNIPQPTEAGLSIRVYVSPPNGDALYHAASMPVGTTSTSILRDEVQQGGRMLETMLHDRVRPASHVAAYRGRIYMASGRVVTYTAALRYGLVKRHQNFFLFPHEVTGILPTLDGIYVGTLKQTYFLGGKDPKDMQQVVVDSSGMVAYSGSFVDGSAFSDENAPPVPIPVWWSTAGELLRGDPNGAPVHLTRNRLALPSFSAGATMQREINGATQIVSTMEGAGPVDEAIAQDTAVVEVIRNGVKV